MSLLCAHEATLCACLSVCIQVYLLYSYLLYLRVFLYIFECFSCSILRCTSSTCIYYMSVLRLWLFVVFLQCPQTHCAASQDNGKMATDGDNRGGLMGSDKLLDR